MDICNIRVGDVSSYSFLPPYDSILSDKTVYEVTNISTLKSLVNKNYNPLENIYELYGMDENDFNQDLEDNVLIVELTLNTKTYYIPLDRITDKEVETNIHYSERMIGIKLGFIPDDEDLDEIMGEISILVKDMLGIEAVVRDTVVSSKVSIEESEHDSRESVREALRGEPGNYKKLYYDLKEMNGVTLVKLRSLEQVVLNTML